MRHLHSLPMLILGTHSSFVVPLSCHICLQIPICWQVMLLTSTIVVLFSISLETDILDRLYHTFGVSMFTRFFYGMCELNQTYLKVTIWT